jgi:arylsulfatase
MKRNAVNLTIGVALSATCAATAAAQTALDRTTLPIPEPKRPHSSVLDVRNAPATAGAFRGQGAGNRPQLLIVLIDDMGFGQPGTFGGPINMPTAERLAKNGLKYNQFHTTALSSPTRAALPDGPQSPHEQHGLHHGDRDGVPGKHRSAARQRRPPLAMMLRYNGLLHGSFRKEPRDRRLGGQPFGTDGPLADAQCFDKFYGFHGRGDKPVGSPPSMTGWSRSRLRRTRITTS